MVLLRLKLGQKLGNSLKGNKWKFIKKWKLIKKGNSYYELKGITAQIYIHIPINGNSIMIIIFSLLAKF